MSFYDRYLAPGDLRARRQPQSASSSSQDAAANPRLPPNLSTTRADWATRKRRKDALLYGGVLFTCLSLFITRRAMTRRRRITYPETFTPSANEAASVNGGLEAVEALGLATLNVTSLAMLAAGGTATYFDIAEIEDMREGVRHGLGYDIYGGDPEADKEMEEWVKDLMTKREEGENVDLKGRIGEKLQELAEIERRKTEEAKRVELKP
ncbi:hypothetical protein B0A50_06419 [Salinomyces thailandicus]|uniref:Altered inheritance of mitochondria protein 11 n=1 Tax=Salinomyces thailandicus TaxID=706561 RepID=A0A4U0TPF1_9PEZI|nr:hypothetical protein B0A50_06419 [Salinomyces thailandica]